MPRRGPRPAGATLKEHIQKALASSGKPVSVRDLTTMVERGGYQTSSKNLANQIGMALMEMLRKREVKRPGRGMYQM
jgi:hypothetical protein